jgi:hypothetical protein
LKKKRDPWIIEEEVEGEPLYQGKYRIESRKNGSCYQSPKKGAPKFDLQGPYHA